MSDQPDIVAQLLDRDYELRGLPAGMTAGLAALRTQALRRFLDLPADPDGGLGAFFDLREGR